MLAEIVSSYCGNVFVGPTSKDWQNIFTVDVGRGNSTG